MESIEKEWARIKKMSISKDDFERTAALTLAFSVLEVALTASGIKKDRKGFMQRFRRLENLDAFPPLDDIYEAITARNKAAHDHQVPDQNHCKNYVGTLHKIWNKLHRRYVNIENAEKLADEILKVGIISDVYLFGSLARNRKSKSANDIDLLLIDIGGASWGQFRGYVTHWENEFILEEIGLDSNKNIAARRCGWLDLVVVDLRLFGSDMTYTRKISTFQEDKLFFVNIAPDLRHYNDNKGHWVQEPPQPFKRLALLREQLENEGIVPKVTAKK